MHVRRSTPIRPRAVRASLALLFVAVTASRSVAQTLTVSSSSPGALQINTATAGGAPNQDTDASTTYSVKTNSSSSPKKIMARINSAMPTGTTLRINLTAVTGSTAVGAVTLSTTNQAVLNNITTTTTRSNAITYTLTATTAAGVITSRSRVVTLTLLDYP